MELPSSQQGSRRAILLAGFILTCVLQLVPAQQRLSVQAEPPRPRWGQNVTLALRGGPAQSQIAQCRWSRTSRSGDPGPALTYTPNNPQPAKGGRETVQQDCSLHITRLTASDSGNYSLVLTTTPEQQTPSGGQTNAGRTYEAFSILQITEPTSITVTLRPQAPSAGQDVTLILGKGPTQLSLCKWYKRAHSGIGEILQTYTLGQPNPQQPRAVVQQNCSLTIKQLARSDAGTYMVWIEAPSDQSKQPGQGTEDPELREEGIQLYSGEVTLNIQEGSSKKDQQHQSGSASLSYSAGVIAAALLGSLAWADPLMTVFSVLFCPFASLRSKLLP